MYSSTGDVQALVKWCTFSATSKITLTEVENYINDADVYIDSLLERIYVVPITNISDREILKYISARFAASEIAQVLTLQASGSIIPPVVTKWESQAKLRLESILDFTVDLPNSSALDSTRGIWSYTACGDADNDFAVTDALWKMNGDNW